jgi:hypothetical protein
MKRSVIPYVLILPLMIIAATALCAQDASGEEGSFEKMNFTGVPKTGQTVSYAAGDDGELESGRPWPAPRFKDNANGTVTDLMTGLIWTKNADQAKEPLEWEEALSRCSACREGEYGDWRLPNRKEFESLLDLGQYGPALPTDHPFANVQSDYYWTSTTPANSEDHGWVIHFYIGLVTHDDKAGTHHVWCVRSGQ